MRKSGAGKRQTPPIYGLFQGSTHIWGAVFAYMASTGIECREDVEIGGEIDRPSSEQNVNARNSIPSILPTLNPCRYSLSTKNLDRITEGA